MKREVVIRWVKKAESDLRSANVLLKADDVITESVCFHCQQAIEKYLKGFLTYHNVRVKKTHDLGMLLEMCLEIDKEFESMDKEKIASLTPFVVEIRYPDEIYTPTIDESREALEIALKIKEFVFKKLKIKESEV